MVIITVFLYITLQEAGKDITELNNSVVDLEEKQSKIAEFFCEDASKFKIEDLFMRVWKFADQLPVLAKVNYLWNVVLSGSHFLSTIHWPYASLTNNLLSTFLPLTQIEISCSIFLFPTVGILG